MDKIFRKTARGVEAIATRQAGLAPRQRSLLILVDGKRATGELAKLGAACGDVEALLGTLLEQGLIEAAHEPAPRAAPAASAATPISMAQVQRLAVRRLNDLLGPSATDLCLRVDGSRTGQELQAALRRAEAVLREALGPQAAERFAQDVQGA